ncbi:30S ribosomal protein THX [Pontibacter liquoris]|nr:30S ribosomal protein THX [Pontibacter liquoris]
MGKGDRKSRKGKITKGTYGNRRPHKPGKAQPKTETKEAAK